MHSHAKRKWERMSNALAAIERLLSRTDTHPISIYTHTHQGWHTHTNFKCNFKSTLYQLLLLILM